MKRELRFVRSADGTSIAFNVAGTGPPLLCAMSLASSIEMDEYMPEANALWLALEERHTVIRPDLRGMGASQRDISSAAPERCAQDIAAVATSLGLSSFDCFASAWGAAAAVIYSSRHPGAISRIAINGLTARHVARDDATFHAYIAMARANREFALRMDAQMLLADGTREQQRQYERAARDSCTVDTVAMFEGTPWDISEELARLAPPCLWMQTKKSWQVPMAEAREAAALVPNARLATIEGVSEYFYLYHDQISALLLDFFAAAPGSPSPYSGGASFTRAPAAALTTRETEVLRLLARGLSNREIGDALVLSERTVARHIANVYAKIDVHGRAEATAYAIHAGLT